MSKHTRHLKMSLFMVITVHGRPVAVVQPMSRGAQVLEAMRRDGKVRWSGGKPTGIAGKRGKRRKKSSPDVGGAVVENRER